MELLIVILILIAALMVEGWLYSRFGLQKLQYRCYFRETEVTEGDVIELVEEVENNKFLPLPWLKVELTIPKWLEPAGAHAVTTDDVRIITGVFAVKSYSRIRRVWQVRATRRGVYRVERAILLTANLLGNVHNSTSSNDLGNACIVLPKPVAMQTGLLSQLLHTMGTRTVPRHWIPDVSAINGVRTYQPADPWNRIHWNATAKARQLMVRQEEYTAENVLWIFLNLQTSSLSDGKHVWESERIEHGIRVCARCILEALHQGIAIQLIVNGCRDNQKERYCKISADTMRQYTAVLRFLAALTAQPTISFERLLQLTVPMRQSCAVLCITPYTDAELGQWYRQQRQCAMLLTAQGTDNAGIASAVIPPSMQEEGTEP